MSGAIWRREIPSIHHLKAGCWVARFITQAGSMSKADARAAYMRAATDGLFDGRDLFTGEEILLAAGLLIMRAEDLVIQDSLAAACFLRDEDLTTVILENLLLHQRPLWMSASLGSIGVSEELLPDRPRESFASVIPDLDQRQKFLLELGRKFDDTERKLIGDIAEMAIVSACRSELEARGRIDLADQVQRVSLISDQLGYDVVAPRLDDSIRHLEVKGTRASGDILSVYISRNEAQAGQCDADWFLTVCRVSPSDEVFVIGWLDIVILAPHLPSDVETGRWQNAVIFLNEKSDLHPGLPPC